LTVLDTILNKSCLVQNGELIFIYLIFLYLIIFSTTKSVSYTEHDDDDGKFLNNFFLLINLFYLDFISKVDNAKKNRNTKSNDQQIEESKSSIRQPPRKRNEKFVLSLHVNQSIKSIFY